MINLKYFKFFIFLICVGFLYYNFSNANLEIISKKTLKAHEIFFLFSFCVIIFHIISFRAYLFIKSSAGYDYSYRDWSKLYFESALLNSFITFTGTAYRAYQLKKRNLNYTYFVLTSYFLYSSYIIINLILVSLELLFIKNFFFGYYIILALILIFIFFYFSIPILEKLTKFFSKFKIFDTYNKVLAPIHGRLGKFKKKCSKKIMIILCFNTIILHIFEISLFYLLSNFFLNNINLQIVIILFAAQFIINRLPVINTIPILNDIIFGLIGVPLGIYFTDNVLLSLSNRIIDYLSLLFNYGLYFVISYYDKNKFVDRDK